MPDDDFQYDVFLSHSAKDKAVVCPLADRLRKDGVKMWFDEWVLKPGDSIESPQSKTAKIEEGLERSRVLVLCMSANAFGSDLGRRPTSGTVIASGSPLSLQHLQAHSPKSICQLYHQR